MKKKICVTLSMAMMVARLSACGTKVDTTDKTLEVEVAMEAKKEVNSGTEYVTYEFETFDLYNRELTNA